MTISLDFVYLPQGENSFQPNPFNRVEGFLEVPWRVEDGRLGKGGGLANQSKQSTTTTTTTIIDVPDHPPRLSTKLALHRCLLLWSLLSTHLRLIRTRRRWMRFLKYPLVYFYFATQGYLSVKAKGPWLSNSPALGCPPNMYPIEAFQEYSQSPWLLFRAL